MTLTKQHSMIIPFVIDVVIQRYEGKMEPFSTKRLTKLDWDCWWGSYYLVVSLLPTVSRRGLRL